MRRPIALSLLLALAGCAAPVREQPGPRLAASESVPEPAPAPPARPAPSALTPEELGRLQALRAATERVRTAYGLPCAGTRCAPELVVVGGLEPVALWDAARYRIGLQRRALAGGVEPRPALAHELGHWVLGHTDATCAGRAFECETAANAEAVPILVIGWAVAREDAVSLTYASLTAGLRRGRSMRGHEAACEEVAVFARSFGRPPPPCPAP